MSEIGFSATPNRRSRLYALCEGYGGYEAAAVLDAVAEVQATDLQRTRDWGGQGLEPWAFFLRMGEVERISADMEWLAKSRASLL